MAVNIICAGPGPHLPASGILGVADTAVTGMLCPSAACQAANVAAQQATSALGANQAAILQLAQAALADNRTYLAIPGPTNAQVVAQVRALTQQTNRLIRLALQQFDGTN